MDKLYIIFFPNYFEQPLLTLLYRLFQKKIKSSLYSSYYAEACNELRGPSPRLSAWATQLRRNVATVTSRWQRCADLTGPGTESQTSRTDSVRLATELTAGALFANRKSSYCVVQCPGAKLRKWARHLVHASVYSREYNKDLILIFIMSQLRTVFFVFALFESLTLSKPLLLDISCENILALLIVTALVHTLFR